MTTFGQATVTTDNAKPHLQLVKRLDGLRNYSNLERN